MPCATAGGPDSGRIPENHPHLRGGCGHAWKRACLRSWERRLCDRVIAQAGRTGIVWRNAGLLSRLAFFFPRSKVAPILSFVGKSGCGKTTIIEKLVALLKKRNYRIAVVKHHAHQTPIDGPGKDSWRFAEAGADQVIVSSPVEIARFQRLTRELALAEIVAGIANVDLVLTEGFKRETAPKIEVSRRELGTDLISRAGEVVAVVSDHPIALSVPRYHLDDTEGLADFVERHFLAA